MEIIKYTKAASQSQLHTHVLVDQIFEYKLKEHVEKLEMYDANTETKRQETFLFYVTPWVHTCNTAFVHTLQ